MDGDHFDALTRRMAVGTTRRSALRALAGGAAGLLTLAGRAGAQACRAAGSACTKDANCCSGLCDTANPDPMKRHRCVCPPGQENCRGACKTSPTDYLSDVLNCGACGNRCPVDQCNRATCTNGVCGVEPNPLRIGKSCDDRDPCRVNDVCLPNGVCEGSPKDCSEQNDVCNLGVCRAPDGVCVKQPLANNTPCERSPANLCTADTCQEGVCTAGPDVVTPTCPAPTQCQASVSCTPATGLCTAIVNKAGGTACETGNLCTIDRCNGQGQCVATGPVACPVCQGCNGGNGSCQPVGSDPRCEAPNTCGGGGVPGQCGCTPEPVEETCDDFHGSCESRTNNCGQSVGCGCPYPFTGCRDGDCFCFAGFAPCQSNEQCEERSRFFPICQDSCCCTPNGPIPGFIGCISSSPDHSHVGCCSGYCDPATNLCADRP